MSIDAIIIGAGLAGATCAVKLAANGKRVVLVDHDSGVDSRPARHDWITQPALDILAELQVDSRPCLGAGFSGATFHSADLSKTMESKSAKPPAFRVTDAELIKCLHERAAELGVRLISRADNYKVNEHNVSVSLIDREPIEAELLVLATPMSTTAPPCGQGNAGCIEQMVIPGGKRSSDDQLHWVLGLDGGGSLASWWRHGPNWVCHYHTGPSVDEVETRSSRLLHELEEQGLIPPKHPDIHRERFLVPRPCAMEVDSHVDKRALYLGEAGGFYTAYSREYIYPAIWSASLAADVLVQALDSDHPQDELREFDSLWRSIMGEYLKVPNTDTHFLFPLVFSNQQMTERLANAFWYGENI